MEAVVLANPAGTVVLEEYCCPVNVLEPVVAYLDSTTVTLLLIEEVNVFNELVAASKTPNLVFALAVNNNMLELKAFSEFSLVAIEADPADNEDTLINNDVIFASLDDVYVNILDVKALNDAVAASKPPTLPLKDAVAVSKPTNLAVALLV